MEYSLPTVDHPKWTQLSRRLHQRQPLDDVLKDLWPQAILPQLAAELLYGPTASAIETELDLHLVCAVALLHQPRGWYPFISYNLTVNNFAFMLTIGVWFVLNLPPSPKGIPYASLRPS